MDTNDTHSEHEYPTVDELRKKYSDDDMPLDGVQVLSFSWVHAGPLSTSILGQLGADVIKIESSRRPDFLRFTFPRPEGADPNDPEKGGLFLRLNLGGKKSVSVNMQHEEADSVIEPLIEQSDLLVENFTADALKEMGWPYDRIKEVNPEMIYVSAASYGHTGPKSHYRGYGSTIDATTGIIQQNGYSDKHPMNHQTSYPDSVGGVTIAYAALAALIEREQTGEGQHVDLDQVEAATSLNGTAVMEASVTGQNPQVRGNNHRKFAPHGIYPCDGGREEWVAIAVRSSTEWEKFKSIVGDDNLDQEKFATQQKRKENEDELDEIIAAWTQERDKSTIVEQLQENSIPAEAVQSQKELISDAQFKQRDAFELLSHPDGKDRPYQRLPFKMSESVHYTRRRAPKLGEHTRESISDLTGLSGAEIEELIENEVLV